MDSISFFSFLSFFQLKSKCGPLLWGLQLLEWNRCVSVIVLLREGKLQTFSPGWKMHENRASCSSLSKFLTVVFNSQEECLVFQWTPSETATDEWAAQWWMKVNLAQHILCKATFLSGKIESYQKTQSRENSQETITPSVFLGTLILRDIWWREKQKVSIVK